MLRDQLESVIRDRDLTAHYQSVVRLQDGDLIGYEGLVRGPAGSPLHDPAALFDAARACRLERDIDIACRRTVLASFAELGLPGLLFLNTSPARLGDRAAVEALVADIRAAGVAPARVVIELTEGVPVRDDAALRQAVTRLAATGIRIAIDSLGGPGGGLRTWAELRPAFVKVDLHFLRDGDADTMKWQCLRSIRDIALALGTTVIAKGVEDGTTLARVRALWVAAPARHPTSQHPATARRLLRAVVPATPALTNIALFDRFAADQQLEVVPVVDHGIPVGLITRRALLDRFATQFIRELHGRKSCTTFMDPKPLIVDQHTPLQALSKSVVEAERHHLFNGFIITDEGRFLGMGTGHDLVREITALQISAARYANPLTGLPGNVPINDEIDRLIAGGHRFVACYTDLDNFKPYNDYYGYRKGDDVIQLTGRVLEAHVDPACDFVGHIGGDDFLVLFRSPDWEARCHRLLDAFAAAITDHFPPADVQRGGYVCEDRRGQKVLHPLVTLSLGIVRAEPDAFESHLEVATVATEAKKQAKRIPGNSMFIDRRSAPPLAPK